MPIQHGSPAVREDVGHYGRTMFTGMAKADALDADVLGQRWRLLMPSARRWSR